MKARRALSLILVMAMILSMFTMILPASAAPSGTRAISATRSRTNYTCYTDEQLMEILELSDISELNTLRSAAYDAVMQNTNWDLSAYNYNWDNLSHKTALTSLIFDHPECFFINNIGGAAYNDGRIAYLTPKYKEGYDVAMEQHAALEAAAQEIMCRFQRTELSDLELAVLIHDYLAANCDYHIATLALSDAERLALGKFSAYDLLVEGSAVCQGYAEAYAYLMMQFGINCGLCDSEALNHAWNILELNGKEYHMDATWDDPTVDDYIADVTWAEPTSDVYGNVNHTNMFLSTAALQLNHKANDFSGTPANTEFDTAFWQGINSSFCLVGDTIYFISSDQKLCTWDHIDTDRENGDESAYEIVELMDLSAKWYAIGNGAWQGYYSRLATDGERLFYSTPSEIREYFPETNTSESVYAPEAKTDEGTGYKYNIFGFHFDGDNFLLNYYYTPNFDATNIAESVHIYDYPVNASETHVYGDPVYITFPCETDGEARYDCIYCGFSKFETIPAAGHTEEPLTGKAATCTEDGLTDGAVCSVCGKTIQEQEPIPAPGHTDETVPGKAATCTEDGLTDGTVCSVCGETIQEQEPIPAPGHDWMDATCTEPAKCSVCGEVKKGDPAYVLVNSVDELKDGGQVVIVANVNGEYKALGTEIADKITPINVTVADNKVIGENLPVWTINTYESGYSLYNGSKYLGYGTSGTDLKSTSEYAWSIEKADGGFNITSTVKTDRGVIYRASTYNVFGGYSTGNTQSEYTRTMMIFQYGEATGSALGHTEEVIPGTPATCTVDGLTDGTVCSVCGEIIRERETIKAPGHTELAVPGKAATCTEDGLTNGIVCSVCDEVIEAQEVIPATGHTEKQVEGSEPTCTQPGMSAGIICATCGISLSDQTIEPALGHDEIYDSNNDGTHTITCSRGDLSETVECSYTNGVCDFCGYEEPVSEGGYELATSIAVGDKVILVCKDAGMELSGISTTSTKYGIGTAYSEIVQELYVLEVVAGSPEGTYAFVNNGNYLCWKSGNSLTTSATIDANSSWKVSFDEGGNAIILNAKDNARKLRWNNSSPRFACYSSSEQTHVQFYKFVQGEAPCEHQWDAGVVTTEPTCTEEGVKTFTCTLCGHTETETVSAKGHSMDKGTVTTEPTCTEDGVKTFTCTACGHEDTETIPSKGHSMDEGTVTTEPTCTENGVMTFTCTACGHEDTETIPSKGHSMDDGAITTAPTCTEDGIKTFTCTACGLEKTEVVPATGHTMEDDTCTVCGYIKPVVTAGQYVIAANVNGTYYAMGNAFASKIAGTVITLTDGKIREDHAEGFVITLAESDGGWTIQNPDGSYLKYASGTDLGKSDTPYVWTFIEGTNGTWRASAQDESRGLVFRTEDSSKEYNQFGGYAVSNITATGTQYYDIELIPVIPAPDAELTNRSISLNGNIAVNFYMSLSDKVVADPDAYMLFKQEGKVDENGNEITVKVTVAECVPKQVRGRTSYVFTYEVAAKEMTDIITAQFFYGDTCTEEYTYSVKTYADNQRTNMADNEALMNLLDAMLNYGAASQLHFGYNIHRLANEGMEPVDYSSLRITGYDLPTEYGTDLVTFVGASLILKSETTLRFFFIVKDGTENFTISYNGTPLEIKSSSGLHYVDVEDISAQNLDVTYSVTVNDGVQEGAIPYSPLTYCQSVRSKDTTAEALANLCGALYLYNSAANNFFDHAE